MVGPKRRSYFGDCSVNRTHIKCPAIGQNVVVDADQVMILISDRSYEYLRSREFTGLEPGAVRLTRRQNDPAQLRRFAPLLFADFNQNIGIEINAARPSIIPLIAQFARPSDSFL